VNYRWFEELPYRQKAGDLCREISQTTEESGLKRSYILRDRIWRAAGFVMNNIAEYLRPPDLSIPKPLNS
jgi:hypothetical protein